MKSFKAYLDGSFSGSGSETTAVRPKNKLSLLLVIALSVAAALSHNALALNDQGITVCEEGCGFQTIQEAIDAANDNDTITVFSGTYHENVIIDKQLHLKSENGTPVVDAGGVGSAITITANYVTIEGFKATNSGEMTRDAGIQVASRYNTITGNEATGNLGSGIYFGPESRDNLVCNNTATQNWGSGFDIEGSCQNFIAWNNASNNQIDGFSLDGSCHNLLLENSASSNLQSGIDLLYGSDYNLVTKTNAYGGDIGLAITSSNNNTFMMNDAYENHYGISLRDSNYNVLVDNDASHNADDGIYLISSSFNEFVRNLVLKNDVYGLYLESSNNNTMLKNNISLNQDEGIGLFNSNNNTLRGNIALGNLHSSFKLYETSVGNLFLDNVF